MGRIPETLNTKTLLLWDVVVRSFSRLNSYNKCGFFLVENITYMKLWSNACGNYWQKLTVVENWWHRKIKCVTELAKHSFCFYFIFFFSPGTNQGNWLCHPNRKPSSPAGFGQMRSAITPPWSCLCPASASNRLDWFRFISTILSWSLHVFSKILIFEY